MKKGWRQRWISFREYYLVLTPEEKKIIVFIGAALLLGLTTKCYREAHPQPAPYVDAKHPWRKDATPSPTPRPKRSRKSAAPVEQTSPNESMSILPESPAPTPRKRGRPRKSPTAAP